MVDWTTMQSDIHSPAAWLSDAPLVGVNASREAQIGLIS